MVPGGLQVIFEAFRKFREERPNSPAFLVSSGDRSVPISWKEFTDDIAAVVWAIHKYTSGPKIAILGENSYQWIVAHAACLLSGSCAVPLDVNLTTEEICERLKFVDAKTIAHSSMFAEKVADVERRMPGILRVGFRALAADSFMQGGYTEEAFSFWKGEGPAREEADGSPRTATIVFTSGTTTVPRGAMLTLAAIESFASAGMKALPMTSGERSLMLLPLHHIFGISSTYLMLVSGVALGVCPDFRRLYDAVVRFRIDFAFLVPALADILAAKCEQHGVNMLKWVLVGGAPISPRTDARLALLGIRVLTGYGLTETAALYSLAPILERSRKGSAGKVAALDGVETKVSDLGELMVKGPNVMLGYYQDPEKTAEVLSPDGWLKTGDKGRIDSDGYVWVTGRLRRTIILSSGKKIAPEELERMVLAHHGIAEVVVSGESESRTITAEIFAGIPEREVRAIVSAVNRELPLYKRIKRVVVRDEPFPKTASGKISLSPFVPSPKKGRPAMRRVLYAAVPRGWWLALSLLAVVAVALMTIAVCFIVYLGTD
jgi:long-chain acyl-CoA synthetase